MGQRKLNEMLKAVTNFTRYRSDRHQDIVSKVLSCQVNPSIRFGVNTNRTVLITLQHHKVSRILVRELSLHNLSIVYTPYLVHSFLL